MIALKLLNQRFQIQTYKISTLVKLNKREQFRSGSKIIMTYASYSAEFQPSFLIMRKTDSSEYASNESSKFGFMQNHDVEVQQFNKNTQTQRFCKGQKINQKHTQNPTKGKYYQQGQYSKQSQYSQQGQQVQKQTESRQGYNLKKNTNQQINDMQNQKPKSIRQQQFKYRQRLTFENKSFSPFLTQKQIKVPFSKLQDAPRNAPLLEPIQPRHSFNPLQNKVNDLERICKQLLQTTADQNNRFQFQRQTILRLQDKIDLVLILLQKGHKEINEYDKSRLKSDQNKKRISIPQKSRHAIDQRGQLESSEKLSRYIQNISCEQNYLRADDLRTNLRAFQERSLYNNSKCISINNTNKIKPFMVNSDIHNQSSIPEIYHHQNMDYPIIQFNQEEDKENINISNLVYQNKHIKKENTKIHSNSTNQAKQTIKHQCKGPNKRNQTQENRRPLTCHTKNQSNEKESNRPQLNQRQKSARQQNQKLKSIPSSKKHKLKSQHETNSRQRTKSEKNTNKKNHSKNQLQNNLKHQTTSIKRNAKTTLQNQGILPISFYVDGESVPKESTYKQIYDLGLMQNSAIFSKVDVPFPQIPYRSSEITKRPSEMAKRPSEMAKRSSDMTDRYADICEKYPDKDDKFCDIKQAKSTQSSRNQRNKNKNAYPNKTVLQSIQQKRKTIDSQLEKRLFKNSAILYAGTAALFKKL